MNHHAGLWIDHKKAVIVSATADPLTATTIESQVGPHSRYSNQSGYPTPNGPQEGKGERSYEQRYGQHLDRYFDEVITKLGHLEALLIFGPGEAKTQFKTRLGHVKSMSECAIVVETTDKLTDPQIIAKVREHFALPR
jgi:hypothetical protein